MSDMDDDYEDHPIMKLIVWFTFTTFFVGGLIWAVQSGWLSDFTNPSPAVESTPPCQGLPGACDHATQKPPATYDSWGTP